MKYSLGLYEKATPNGLNFESMLETARLAGFDRLEVSIDETDRRLKRLDGEARALSSAVKNTGVEVSTMCLSGHRRFPGGSHDSNVRSQSVDIMKKAVDFSCQTGIRLIQLAGYDVYYETGDEYTRGYFLESLNKYAEYASVYGVLLGFETMETEFMDTVGKAMKYVNAINSPYLGVYPDIGNLKNASVKYSSDIINDLQLGRGHIFAAHLKETRPGVYRDMEFGQGHTEYETCISELLKQGVRMFTGEFWYANETDNLSRLKNANSFLRRRIENSLANA